MISVLRQGDFSRLPDNLEKHVRQGIHCFQSLDDLPDCVPKGEGIAIKYVTSCPWSFSSRSTLSMLMTVLSWPLAPPSISLARLVSALPVEWWLYHLSIWKRQYSRFGVF